MRIVIMIMWIFSVPNHAKVHLCAKLIYKIAAAAATAAAAAASATATAAAAAAAKISARRRNGNKKIKIFTKTWKTKKLQKNIEQIDGNR